MDELRLRCPWDQKQTIHTLRGLTIEETYELADAILGEDWTALKGELGDLLLHLVFYSRIASEEGHFAFDDVVQTVCDKLVARHPHIYGSTIAETDTQVAQNWEKIKLRTGAKSVLGGVPTGLPALVKALRLQEKAGKVGFEWEHTEEVRAKVDEELAELAEAVRANDADAKADEFGDVLFSLVNYARFIGVDPEAALERTNRKFKARFESMESAATATSRPLHDMSLAEMDALWNEAKRRE